MLFQQKISPGDFVIGARRWKAGREFSVPRMVIDVKEDDILVMTEDGTIWYHISKLERVVQSETRES